MHSAAWRTKAASSAVNGLSAEARLTSTCFKLRKPGMTHATQGNDREVLKRRTRELGRVITEARLQLVDLAGDLHQVVLGNCELFLRWSPSSNCGVVPGLYLPSNRP